MRTAYRCRAYPDQAQQAVLSRTFGCVQVVWNRTLDQRHQLCHAEGTSLSYAASDGYGRDLIVIGRWYPSSKTCPACGHLLAELTLATRHWTCPSCGARHDRDINAAKNILAAGQAVTACGADVRHSGTSRVQSAVKQEPRPVTAGIPVPRGGE